MKEVEKTTSPVKEEKDQENDGELEVSEEKLAAGMKISVFFLLLFVYWYVWWD